MTEAEVKKLIGKHNWRKFCKWMYGQTVGSNKDGSINWYDHDVRSFKKLIDTGHDRQKTRAWD